MAKGVILPKRQTVTPEMRVMLRTSERASYKTCRQQWQWKFNDRIRPTRTAPALTFGALMHAAFEIYYKPGRKRGLYLPDAFQKVWETSQERGFLIYADGEPEDALELGIEMATNYVDRWGDEDHIEILWAEMPFELDMFDPKGRYLVTYVGKFDSVFKDHSKTPKQIGLFEHKTAAAIDTKHLALDEQAGSYWAFAGEYLQSLKVFRPGREIDFILYNFLRKAKRDRRPQDEAGHYLNKNGTISKNQPPPLFQRQPVYRSERDKENLLTRVKMEAWEMKQVRAGKLPIYKNPKLQWPDQHCNGCGFRDMCELHETGNDWIDIRDATMELHDPYEDHQDPLMEFS